MNVDINSASASLSKGGSRPRNLVAMVDQSGYLEVRLHTIELIYATSLDVRAKQGQENACMQGTRGVKLSFEMNKRT